MALTREEYLERIFDHKENPYHNQKLDPADITASGGNPGCGDLVTLYVRLDDAGKIVEAAFEGEGCTISQAGASMLTELVEGKTIDDVLAMNYEDIVEMMGREVVMTRVRCATLALSILKQASNDYQSKKGIPTPAQ